METGETLAGDVLIAEMKGERWDEIVARFEADAVVDPDAGELQRVYEAALRESLSSSGLALAHFGCGLSLCAGTILGPLEDGALRYDAWRSRGMELPMPVFVEFRTDNARYMEVRFTFSTDPSARSITIGR